MANLQVPAQQGSIVRPRVRVRHRIQAHRVQVAPAQAWPKQVSWPVSPQLWVASPEPLQGKARQFQIHSPPVKVPATYLWARVKQILAARHQAKASSVQMAIL
ncbi:hypothetical protein GQ602_005441 [Ophiocordyceps camponoti-floridani]|uniref:Uncharacterized protein n=1 Tax=Ophiocordyceps camponoti-floridani TaxID=2030778 RepID=A0A8H4VC33_9HYPO|nr:hypothetical protein GQ602_005441 [Ophiocordyceps camponoti-floridani]